ncbi:hypothetical protein LCGC14_0341890 [marine sediment metagenome]|uniref:Uncharacterized protein n=1 Tax=marine sediment metagenome TaxID=412755 RepID=A0A0F9TW46_9ZZZZ
MGSTFKEIYGDYQDSIKNYVEKLDVTPLSFMRQYTKGMQVFQRETEYFEKTTVVQRDTTTSNFLVPDDFDRLIEAKDYDGKTLLYVDYIQFTRIAEKFDNGLLETPVDYSTRLINTFLYGNLSYLYQYSGNNRYGLLSSGTDTLTKIITMYNRVFYINNDDTTNNTEITINYIPILEPISGSSSQWTNWQPLNGVNFNTAFANFRLSPEIINYEDTFLNYAISRFLRSQGSVNYKVYEQEFWADVKRAIANKPVKFREGVRSYNMAPFS